MKSLPQLPPRSKDSHKGHFGRVLVIGGSAGMPGAPSLAALSALRSGAGLVQIACPDCIRSIVATLVPEATNCSMAIDDYSSFNPTVKAVGPGCRDELTKEHLVAILKDVAVPAVLDADGLNTLAKIDKWWRLTHDNVVLTPHPGEMHRLIERMEMPEAERSRSEMARQLAQQSGAIVALKGYQTVVSDGKMEYINETGNPGMATGGSGDVLTGVIAALIGQGLRPYEAACMGVHIHGLAGDFAAAHLGEVSLIATDIVDALPEAFQAHRYTEP